MWMRWLSENQYCRQLNIFIENLIPYWRERISQKMSTKNEMEQVLIEIKDFFQNWLEASNMTEEEFLAFRTCEHFRIKLEERIDGFAVQLRHGKEQMAIGYPFFVGHQNNILEKEQYFKNTPLILMYMAGQLDKANVEKPVNGSYGPEYFKERTRKVCKEILKKGYEVLEEEFKML